MQSLSNTIKDPKTGEILIFSDLFKGIRTIADENTLKKNKMHPQSGTVRDAEGNLISLVDLILSGGDLSNYYTKQEIEQLILNAGVEGGGIDLSRYALVDHAHNEYSLSEHKHTEYAEKTEVYNKTEVDEKFNKFVPPSNSEVGNGEYVLKDIYEADLAKIPKVYIQTTIPTELKAGDIWIRKNV